MKRNSNSTIRQILLTLILLCLCILPAHMVRAESNTTTQGNTTTHLPFVATPPRVLNYAIATSNSCTGDYDGEPQGAPVTVAYGFKRLGHATYVLGGQGLPWREEWSYNGDVAGGLTSSGTITQAEEYITSSIVYGPNGNCGRGVPAGEWIVRFYLDGWLAQEAVVTIR